MQVRVRFAAILKVRGIQSGDSVRLPAGTDLSGLLDRLGVPRNQQGYILAWSGGRRLRLEQTLGEGEELELFLPVGGG